MHSLTIDSIVGKKCDGVSKTLTDYFETAPNPYLSTLRILVNTSDFDHMTNSKSLAFAGFYLSTINSSCNAHDCSLFKISLHDIENKLSISPLFVSIDTSPMILTLIILSQKQYAGVQVETKSIIFTTYIKVKEAYSVNIYKLSNYLLE